MRLFCFCFFLDFCSFYNILKNCRGHSEEQSVFTERTEESSAVQYFQVQTGGRRGAQIQMHTGLRNTDSPEAR